MMDCDLDPHTHSLLHSMHHFRAAQAMGRTLELRFGHCDSCGEDADLTYLDLCPHCFKLADKGELVRSETGCWVRPTREAQAEYLGSRQTARLETRVGVCYECDAVYLLAPAQLLTEPLPCGHKVDLYLTEANLLAALRDADFVEWAHRRDLLEHPIGALRFDGGAYNPLIQGPMRLRLPGGAI